MTPQLYALTVVGICLAVICINIAALVVVSADVLVWKDERQRMAERLTYWVCLCIAAFVFAVLEFA